MQEQHNKTKNTNKLVILLISITLAGSFIIILLSTLNSQRATEESVINPTQVSPSLILDTATPLPTISPTENPTKPVQQVLEEDILARVNDEIITSRYFQIAIASDKALLQLLDQEAEPVEQMLDRLINEELVHQDAQRSAYSVTDQEAAESLEIFLSQNRKITQDLELSLLENGVDLETFWAYYSQLYLVDQFSRQQAQVLNLSIQEYIQKLQSEAHISFGPAARLAAGPENSGQEQANITPTTQPADTGSKPATSEASKQPNKPGTDNPGKLAPDFDLAAANAVDRDRIRLEDLQGKPVMLSFFTTWCPYCQNQTPSLVQAHKQYGQKIQFIGIDVNESQEQVKEYVKRMGINYPVLLDSNNQIARAYQVSGFPTTFFLDAEGKILSSYVGQLSEEKISEYLSKFAPNPP